MTKIKIVGASIFILSIVLAILFNYTSRQNNFKNEFLSDTNTQKAFTQEISKNIFYLYKNKDASYKELDNYIKKFSQHMNNKDQTYSKVSTIQIDKQNKIIIKQWNEFYLSVQNFRDQSKTTAAYSNIILEKTVNDIYNKNLMLIVNLNKLIELHHSYFDSKLTNYKTIQSILFASLVILLIYLFTQIKVILSFIQKFIHTSQKIKTNASIKDLAHIKVDNNSSEILKATNNFNFLVDKIDKSINNSTLSIQHSIQSLEIIENNIEDLLELVDIMDENGNIDKDLTKKEDTLIQSLEELTTSQHNLQALKADLDNLISHSNQKNS